VARNTILLVRARESSASLSSLRAQLAISRAMVTMIRNTVRTHAFLGDASMADFDVLICGGMVIDGTGKPGRRMDVGIRGDRIAAVGRLGRATASRTVDATDHVVAPGFIDIHHHASTEIESNPAADNMLRQGVTTVVGGNCGGGPTPLGPHLNAVEALEIRQNYACLAGVGSGYAAALAKLRLKKWNRRARQVFLDQLEDDFDAGAVGYSSGLVYTPHITTDVVVDGARVAARYGTFYGSHIRNEGDSLLGAVEELIFICRTAGLPGQISHVKCYGRRNWGKAGAVLELMERSNREGLDVTADQYPYTGCYSGLMGHVLPLWARTLANAEGGWRRLLRGDVAGEVRRDMVECLALVGGPGRLILCPHQPDPALDGRRLSEFLNGSDDVKGLVRLLDRAGPKVSAICMVMCEEDVETYMPHPLVMTASDANLRRFGQGFTHPRNYGTFPRVLARYVRERKTLTLEHAVQRATSMPARRLGFRRRGVIARGKIADIAIFHRKRVRDTATFGAGHAYPRGIPCVLVAGRLAVDGGKTTSRGHGRVLRRGET